MFDPIVEKYRKTAGEWGTREGEPFGLFFIPFKIGKTKLKVIVAPFDKPGYGWEHVSVSLPNRCPTWNEMCFVKKLFWGEDVTVVQFHPKKEDYKNLHPYCLHLFRHADGHELPPSITVAPY